MKLASEIQQVLTAGALAGMLLCLAPGCASSSAQNRKVYDRYAALVAERNRSMGAPADASAGSVAPTKPSTPRAPVKPVDLPPAKPEAAPAAATVKAAPLAPPPVQVIAPKPAAPVAVSSAPDSAPVKPVAAPVVPAPMVAPQTPVPQSPPPSAVAAAEPASPSADGVAYQLKVGDVVQVFLRGIPTADAIEDVIDEEGMISLPLINEILAAGMTASELERNIRKTYLDQDIYRNITVNVVVPTRYYFIQGETRQPGRYQIMSATRLSQAIAGAGGYTEFASGQVVVKRAGKIFKTIRNSRRLERTPEDDILLEPDDIIEVKRSLW